MTSLPGEPVDVAPLQPPPMWPRVVGIISITWAAIGLVCGLCGLGGMAAQTMFMPEAERSVGGPMPAVMKPGAMPMVMLGISMATSLLLLIAGIATVGRRRSGRMLHLVYALIDVPLIAVNTLVSVQQQVAIADWAKQNPADPWAKQSNPVFGLAILAFFTVIAVAWVVFLLIWFGPMKKRPEVGAPDRTVI
jgi:hypothetical protein